MLGARQAPVTHPCSQRAVSNLGILASHAFVAPTTVRSHAGLTTESQPESFASGSFVWTKSAKQILEKVRRARQTLGHQSA